MADDRELEALADELNNGDEEGGDRPRDAEPIKDNRDLVDWGQVTKGKQTNQKLGDQEVVKLKKEGASGKDLIKTIAENRYARQHTAVKGTPTLITLHGVRDCPAPVELRMPCLLQRDVQVQDGV